MRYTDLDEYKAVRAGKTIMVEDLYAMDTVDITNEFVRTNNVVGIDGHLFKTTDFHVEDSVVYPGKDKLIIDIKKL